MEQRVLVVYWPTKQLGLLLLVPRGHHDRPEQLLENAMRRSTRVFHCPEGAGSWNMSNYYTNCFQNRSFVSTSWSLSLYSSESWTMNDTYADWSGP